MKNNKSKKANVQGTKAKKIKAHYIKLFDRWECFLNGGAIIVSEPTKNKCLKQARHILKCLELYQPLVGMASNLHGYLWTEFVNMKRVDKNAKHLLLEDLATLLKQAMKK